MSTPGVDALVEGAVPEAGDRSIARSGRAAGGAVVEVPAFRVGRVVAVCGAATGPVPDDAGGASAAWRRGGAGVVAAGAAGSARRVTVPPRLKL
ncbi:MAG: hypothetical protein ABIW33_06390 [Sphingomicrobium sp.]